MLARHPRGFKQAMIFLLGFVAYLFWIAIDSGFMPPERVAELRALVFFWE